MLTGKIKNLFCANIIFVLISFLSFADGYKINSVNYNVTGCGWKIFGRTNPYAISLNVPVDTNQIFTNEDDLNKYLDDYKVRLANLRAFETIEVNETRTEEENLTLIDLEVFVKDSFHLLAVPYPKYDSNNGLNLKFKIKDTNFLGTLNTLSTDIFILFASQESDNKTNQIGFNFDFDFPFDLGIFDVTWVNEDSFSYTFGEVMPEWNAKTGFKFELPVKNLTFTLEAYQYVINDFDYKDYGDNFYFKEDFKFSVPITLTKILNKYELKYSPYVEAVLNWDKDGINEENTDLLSPLITAGHSIYSNRVNWSENMRNGYDVTLFNSFNYNVPRNIFYTEVGIDALFFHKFEFNDWNIKDWHFLNRLGINTNIYFYANYILNDRNFEKNDGRKIGERLRGIRDDQLYSDETLGKSCLTTSAIVLNLDFPLQILKTNLPWDIINFDFQISPFIDAALIKNKMTGKYFDPKDGFYCAGFEALVFPKKWSSMTVRASVGVDIGRLLFSDYLNMDWRNTDTSKVEISFGVGLFY